MPWDPGSRGFQVLGSWGPRLVGSYGRGVLGYEGLKEPGSYGLWVYYGLKVFRYEVFEGLRVSMS